MFQMDHQKLFLSLVLIASAGFCHGKTKLRACYQDCHIDCGASNKTVDGYVTWSTDDSFINTGRNYLLTESQHFTPMNSLRYFPSGHRNCYKFQFIDVDQKAIFRAGFAYGNYDGLFRPPSFDLEIDGNLWTTVTASMNEDEAQFYEVIYRVKGDTSKVCLVRTNADEVPFISSLEGILIYDYGDMYRLLQNGTALHLHSRINYGANTSIGQHIHNSAEKFSRYWKSEESSEYLNITSGGRISESSMFLGENQPPEAITQFAIQSKNLTDSIRLPLGLSPQLSSVAYLVLYFKDPLFRYPLNRTCNVEILVDGVKLGATSIGENDYHAVTLYPVQVTKPSMEIVIAPVEGSTKAPLINAMEVFYVTTLSSAGCSLHFFITLGFISFIVYAAWLF